MENEVQLITQPVQPLPQNPAPTSIPTPQPSNTFKIIIFVVLGLLFLMGAVYAGIQIGKNQTTGEKIDSAQETISPTKTTNNPSDQLSPSPTVDPTADWKTYKNEQYKFEFKYPTDGKLEVSQTGYVRIQNYISDDLPGLKSGEYYLEFNLPPSTTTCKNSILEPEMVNQSNGVIYKGLGQEGGDAGGLRFALCAEKLNMNLFIMVTENNQSGKIANQILSTFKFLDSSDTTTNTKKIGYIKSIVSNNDIYKIQVDYVDLIRDNTAPNGHRIDNPSTELTTISVQQNPTVIMQTYSLTQDGNYNFGQSITYSEFLSAFNSGSQINKVPYWLEIQNGKLVKITEQYLP